MVLLVSRYPTFSSYVRSLFPNVLSRLECAYTCTRMRVLAPKNADYRKEFVTSGVICVRLVGLHFIQYKSSLLWLNHVSLTRAIMFYFRIVEVQTSCITEYRIDVLPYGIFVSPVVSVSDGHASSTSFSTLLSFSGSMASHGRWAYLPNQILSKSFRTSLRCQLKLRRNSAFTKYDEG